MDQRKYIVNRDYAKRLYVSRDPKERQYNRQIREITDKQIDNLVRYPHSESKKPYRDEDYPFMEYKWTPFNFDWPDFDIPEFPDDEYIIPNPEIPDVRWPPEEPREGFKGCFFAVPITPPVLEKGQTAYAKLQRRDDPIVNLTIQGPASVISQNAINCHSNYHGGLSSPECTVVIQAAKDLTGYGAVDGLVQIVLIATTASGSTCSTSAFIIACPDSCDLEWDWTNSVETLVAPDSGNVFVLLGTPPFTWEISSEDGKWSLFSAATSERSNIVTAAAGACGAATITVTDSCGCTVTGSVRNPDSGSWSLIDQICGISGAPTTNWHSLGSNIWEAELIRGRYREVDRLYRYSATSFGGSFLTMEACLSDYANDVANNCINPCGVTGCNGTTCAQACLDRPNIWVATTDHCACASAGGDSLYFVSNTVYATGCLGGCAAPFIYRHCGFCFCTITWYYYEWIC